jgi:hypothetical protein
MRMDGENPTGIFSDLHTLGRQKRLWVWYFLVVDMLIVSLTSSAGYYCSHTTVTAPYRTTTSTWLTPIYFNDTG